MSSGVWCRCNGRSPYLDANGVLAVFVPILVSMLLADPFKMSLLSLGLLALPAITVAAWERFMVDDGEKKGLT